MWKKIKENTSLSQKIIGFGLVVLLIQAAFSFYNVESLATKYEKEVDVSFEHYAESLSEKISAQLYERYGDVQAFAANSVMPSLNNKAIQPKLDQYIALYGIYDLIVVVDKNGRLVSANSKDPQGKPVNWDELKKYDFSSEPWFKSALAEQYTTDKKNNYNGTYVEDFISDSLMKPAFGEAKFGTSFSAPIKDENGKIVGVISNRAGKRWFETELTNFWSTLHDLGYVDAELTVTNKDGYMISFVGTDDKDPSKMFSINDPQKILSENFVQKHVSVGPELKKSDSGHVNSKYEGESETDLVGFSHIDDNKSIASMGWTVFVHDNREDAYKNANAAIKAFYILLAIGLTLGTLMAYFVGKWISTALIHSSEPLETNSNEVKIASEKIAVASTELSVAAREQSSALQETVTAVDEINATVQKNTEMAVKSKEVSGYSKEACENGKRIVENMMSAIADIEETNTTSSNQMIEANRQLTEITKLFNDISSKTKVINEIVFQTKLLSFNASVEAARAGEYGKGFAVVAEEVGNLAKMSGEASKEISTLLEESVHKVNDIVSESKSKIENMMSVSKTKIKVGMDTAMKCNEALDTILNNVQEVDQMVHEISVASQEQATGVKEISSAISELEQVTLQNSSAAESAAAAAEQLRAQAEGLNQVVVDINGIIHGQGAQAQPTIKKSTQAQVIPLPKSNKEFKAASATGFKKTGTGDFIPSADDEGFKE